MDERRAGCSVTRHIQIVTGCLDDYKTLADHHYRGGRLCPFAAIFALKATGITAVRLGKKAVGVIVYTMPSPALEMRNVATGNLFIGFDRATQLALVNSNIRCIGRVTIEPRFRGLGLASRLVRETMPKMDVPIIEAMAVMGQVNPFFEKAGMKAYSAKMPARCVQLIEAFSMAGVEKELLIDPQEVQQRIEKLQQSEAEFIEHQMRDFLQSYGRRRDMPSGIERTRYILSKLTSRPVYYIWFNGKTGFRV